MSTTHTVKIAGSDSNVVGQIAHGLMMLTWTTQPVPYEQAFEAIKAGIDSLPQGVKMLLNSAEFYDNNLSVSNLDLVAAFFEKYPDYADRAFLAVKGGSLEDSMELDLSPANLKRSVDRINKHLRGVKKMDVFQPARADRKVRIEDTVKLLAEFVKEGKFDYIGLSEVSAETLRRANAVHPIAVVEIEVSPWSYEEETKKVIATAKESGTVVLAYSPLGRGFLTGKIKSRADFPAGDLRLNFTRFSEENIKHNVKIVEELSALAEEKGVTPAQLSLAWIGALGSHIVPIPGSSKKSRTLENLAAANVTLTTEEFEKINAIVTKHGVVGDRYFGAAIDAHLWG